MTTSFLDPFAIRQEIAHFIRNSDILSITERGVTTTQETGTFASDSTHLIVDSQIKNIRDITVASVVLTFGEDYTYDTDFNDTTFKTKITFTNAQTGAYEINYDTGSDKIYPDFPRDDLSIDSYPRIAIDVQDSGSDAFGIGGNEYLSDIVITAVVYSQSTKQIDNLIKSIRDKIITNNKNFFNFKFIKPVGIGPLIQDPTKRQEIMSRNVDFLSVFNVECIQ